MGNWSLACGSRNELTAALPWASNLCMSFSVKMDLQGFGALPVQRRCMVLRSLVEAMVVINWQFIIESQGPSSPHHLPPMLEFHKQRPFKLVEGAEVWRNIPAILESGGGGLKDFVCWRIAELRAQGEDEIYPHIKYTADPENKWGGQYKMSVRRGDAVEDMAQLLGFLKN